MAVTEITSPPATTVAAKHKAVSTALPPARGQSFLRLVTTELRKSLDTRSGRVLVLAILALAVAALTWQLTHTNNEVAGFRQLPGRCLGRCPADPAGDRCDGDDE